MWTRHQVIIIIIINNNNNEDDDIKCKGLIVTVDTAVVSKYSCIIMM